MKKKTYYTVIDKLAPKGTRARISFLSRKDAEDWIDAEMKRDLEMGVFSDFGIVPTTKVPSTFVAH